MSAKEYTELMDKIIYGLQVAEREMFEKKTKDNMEIIVCCNDGVIRSVPSKNFVESVLIKLMFPPSMAPQPVIWMVLYRLFK